MDCFGLDHLRPVVIAEHILETNVQTSGLYSRMILIHSALLSAAVGLCCVVALPFFRLFYRQN